MDWMVMRRRTVLALAGGSLSTALAGCLGGDGDGSSDTPTETESTPESNTETDESEDGTPSGDGTESEDGSGEDGTNGESSGEPETVGEAVTQANDIIDRLNNDPDGSLSSINERLANVEPVGLIDPVEAETESAAMEEASRLREEWNRVQEEIFTQVPKEINAQSQEEFDFKLIEDVDALQTAEDAREAAEGDASISQEAVDALNGAADIAEDIEAGLNEAATILESIAGSE
jgi:hypothetical protein